MSGTEIAVVDAAPLTTQLSKTYDPDLVNVIRATVASDCGEAEFALFLETALRLDLNPITKEIWAAKIGGKVQIFAANAGLFSIAQRFTPAGRYHVKGEGMYIGTAADVVRAHDYFRKVESEREDGTRRLVIEHEYRDAEGKPTHGGPDGSLRGPIVSAWARVRRKGHDDYWFYAPRAEYDKHQNAWKTNPSAMMQKAAESVALRKAFSISGVVGEAEMPNVGPEPAALTTGTAGPKSGVIEWPADEALTEGLKSAFAGLGYTQAKIRLAVNGKSESELRALLTSLEADLYPEGVLVDADVVEPA